MPAQHTRITTTMLAHPKALSQHQHQSAAVTTVSHLPQQTQRTAHSLHSSKSLKAPGDYCVCFHGKHAISLDGCLKSTRRSVQPSRISTTIRGYSGHQCVGKRREAKSSTHLATSIRSNPATTRAHHRARSKGRKWTRYFNTSHASLDVIEKRFDCKIFARDIVHIIHQTSFSSPVVFC